MIIESYNLGNTRIRIADDCKLQDEKQRKMQIENFNKVGYRILQNSIMKEVK